MPEPITLDQAKAFLRVDGSAQDSVIADAITDARGWIENYTGLVLVRRAVQELLPSFSRRLRSWPIVSIDAVSYVDADGADRTLQPGDYRGQIEGRPGALLAPAWPSILKGSRIRVEMTAGFEDAEAIAAFSPNIMRAMRELVTGYFGDRETGGRESEESARDLCRAFKDWTV